MSALDGMRVLVTRPERQAAPLVEALRVAGAEAVVFPATRIDTASDGGAALRRAAETLGTFDWVAVSSANGAERILAAAEGAGTGHLAAGRAWACVGPGTAAALRRAGIEPRLVAQRHDAEGLLAALGEAGVSGARVLLPQAAAARRVLRDGLEAAGAEVHAVEAYRSVPDGRGAEQVRERLDRGEIDVITFTSPSTVERFVDVMGVRTGGPVVAVIGPVTGEAAAALGLPPQIVAEQHSVPGLVAALVEHFQNPSRTKQP